jgi:hypothetical protein
MEVGSKKATADGGPVVYKTNGVPVINRDLVAGAGANNIAGVDIAILFHVLTKFGIFNSYHTSPLSCILLLVAPATSFLILNIGVRVFESADDAGAGQEGSLTKVNGTAIATNVAYKDEAGVIVFVPVLEDAVAALTAATGGVGGLVTSTATIDRVWIGTGPGAGAHISLSISPGSRSRPHIFQSHFHYYKPIFLILLSRIKCRISIAIPIDYHL